ncbi:MAG: GHKL domain-containing protein [Pseudobutyrivibrio sp.]|nr:GHKL domain-containing protein [Pseudobutyrivibrio sp.]
MQSVICVLIIYTIWTLLDIFNIFTIYDKFLCIERKSEIKKASLLWIPVILIISYIVGFNYAGVYYNKIVAKVIRRLVIFKIIPLLWSFFKKRYKDILIVLFYQLLIATASQGLYMFVVDIKYVGFYELFVFDLCQLSAAVLITLLLVVLLIFRNNNIIKVYFGELTTFNYIVFCIAIYVSNLIEAGIILLYPDDTLLKKISFLNVIMVGILICQLIFVRESETRKSKVIDILDEQMVKLTDHYNDVIEHETNTKKFRHDIRNFLLVLYSMVENKEIDESLEYIEKMQDICKTETNKYDTGNFIADTLIGAKSGLANKINTQIVFDGYVPSELENVDLVILLSNMLDNALEACEKIEGSKLISIDSILEKKVWIIVVKNPIKENIKIQRNRISTTKSNREIHGYGIQNMERVAQKYDGNLTLECEDGIFCARAMLKLTQEY